MIQALLIAAIFANGVTTLPPGLPASYKMEIRVDADSNKLYGSEQVTFYNPTPASLESICFHLYPNAFKDTSTIICRENMQVRSDVASGNKSYLHITDLAINGATIDSASIRESGTLFYIKLAKQLMPDSQLAISMKYELLIPKVSVRFGYDKWGNYIFSHCHPILCGYQKGWLIDAEYHYNSEFFSNFSNYDVTIDIPQNYRIGSTGTLSLIDKDSTRARWHAIADTVIDFAFAMGPKFKIFETDTLGIKIHYLLNPEHEKQFDQADKITKYSLAYGSNKFFKYPYYDFTVVDINSGASGMELPQMIAIDFPMPRSRSVGKGLLDFIIAHETTHEWFYGMVASNESEEPWLDEGVTSYFTSRLLTDNNAALAAIDFFGYKIPFYTLERVPALMSKAEYPINLRSWDYPGYGEYNISVYYRTTIVLQTLEGLLGRTSFDGAFNAYANKFRLGHPDKHDFWETITSNSATDLSQFRSQFADGTSRLDYSVRTLEYKLLPKQDSAAGDKYKIDVTIARELDGILPQKLIVGLENGAHLDTTWDGADPSRIKSFEFVANSKPEYALIDSGHVYTIDENTGNNSIYIKTFGSRLISFEWDLLFLKELFLSLIL